MPQEAINVVKEDLKNPDLLYVGTDHSVYISLDRGKNFMRMSGSMPAVPVHDLMVHPRENDLIVGTHGRGIYIANVEHLQKLTPALMAGKLHMFDMEPVQYNPRWGQQRNSWQGESRAEVTIPFYTSEAGNSTIRIKTEKGKVVKELKDQSERGLNYVSYNLSVEEANAKAYEAELNSSKKEGDDAVTVEPAEDKLIYLQPGKYTVEIQTAGTTQEQDLTIKAPQQRTRD